MAISSALQAALNSPARTAGEHFKSEAEANAHMAELKAAGFGNVRKARWHDYTKPDGTKVYQWVVRCNAEPNPPKPMPKTLKAFNRRLAKDGVPVEVVQGQGYVYFIYEDGNPAHYTSHSVSVCYWDQMAPARWLAEVADFAAAHAAKLPELDAFHAGGPRKLTIGR